MLGLSYVYFPMFEECLAKYNIPLELKYLAMVESALNPTAGSYAGAKGLWQFMPITGKYFSSRGIFLSVRAESRKGSYCRKTEDTGFEARLFSISAKSS